MKTLLLDTAHRLGFVAVGDGEVVAYRRLETERLHSERMVLAVEEVLEEAGWSLNQIKRIGVGAGPGSYTGIRVAMAYAQGVALATKARLTSFSSLSLYEGVAAFDARAGGVYYQNGGEPQVASIEEFSEILEGVDRVISPDALLLEERLSESDVIWEEALPSIERALELAKGETRGVSPFYLRGPLKHNSLKGNLCPSKTGVSTCL